MSTYQICLAMKNTMLLQDLLGSSLCFIDKAMTTDSSSILLTIDEHNDSTWVKYALKIIAVNYGYLYNFVDRILSFITILALLAL